MELCALIKFNTLTASISVLSLYVQRPALEQRRLLNFLLSNCTLEAGKVNYNYKMPFDIIVKGLEVEKISG
jgi:hypothetical protein